MLLSFTDLTLFFKLRSFFKRLVVLSFPLLVNVNVFDFLFLFGNLEKITGNFPGLIVTIEGKTLNFDTSTVGYKPQNGNYTFLLFEEFKNFLSALVEQKKIILKRKVQSNEYCKRNLTSRRSSQAKCAAFSTRSNTD